MTDSGLLRLLPAVREFRGSGWGGYFWDSVGRRSSCLFCPYQRSDPDLRPPVTAGARRKLGQRVSQPLSTSLSPPTLLLSLTYTVETRARAHAHVRVFDYLRARAKLWISCVKACAHLFLAGSQSCVGGTISAPACVRVRARSAPARARVLCVYVFLLCNSQQMTTWGDGGFTVDVLHALLRTESERQRAN